MKKLVPFALVFALLASPLFAEKKATVTIPNDVNVGSTQISAGEYKLAYEGSGPVVTVTLAQRGHSPIALDAKLVPTIKLNESVTMGRNASGERTLLSIDLGRATLVFDAPEPAQQPQPAAQ